MSTQRRVNIHIHIFTITESWKQPQCLLTLLRQNVMYLHYGILFSNEKSEQLTYARTWVNHSIIMLIEKKTDVEYRLSDFIYIKC